MSSLPFVLSNLPAALSADQGLIPPVDDLQKKFIDYAFAMRQKAIDSGDQPYGAIVVKDGEIIGEGPSRVIVDQDPTAHAEMVAIRNAAQRLNSRDLNSCIMFSTSKPCRMCETASYWAGIDQLFYSSQIVSGGAPQYSSC
ncbi:MAG: nucleoside deaminase [Arenicellales bacterium]|nr:nucleoside deaminase [Arenicellales bacterium]